MATKQVRFENKLQFQAIRISKENSVVTRRLVILRWRIEHGQLLLTQECVELINIIATLGIKRKVMKTRRVAVVLSRCLFRRRGVQGNGKYGA